MCVPLVCLPSSHLGYKKHSVSPKCEQDPGSAKIRTPCIFSCPVPCQNILYIVMPSSTTVRTLYIVMPSSLTEHPVYCHVQFPDRTSCILSCPVPWRSEHPVYCHAQCPDSDQLKGNIYCTIPQLPIMLLERTHVTCVTVTLTVKLAWLPVQSVFALPIQLVFATDLRAKLFQPKTYGHVWRCGAVHRKRNPYRPSTDFSKPPTDTHTHAHAHTHKAPSAAVAYPGIFFGGGVQQIQLRTDDRENGDLGTVAP